MLALSLSLSLSLSLRLFRTFPFVPVHLDMPHPRLLHREPAPSFTFLTSLCLEDDEEDVSRANLNFRFLCIDIVQQVERDGVTQA